MLANSGANFGINRTLPLLLGCNIGLFIMLLLVTCGAGQLFEIYPWLNHVLLYLCTGYLLYLGYQLTFGSSAKADDEATTVKTPIGFLQGAFIQAINPGIWMLAVASMGFASQVGSGLSAGLIICTIVTLANLPAIGIWAVSGSSINKLLQCPRRQHQFNMVLSVLTLLTIPMLWLN
ncbi:LysE family translocator [Sinobacterium caligoides]|uniref:LysE family translocator n=1 Tax=Sinobacterium caligoides TaxID=933926 RepID=UPI0013C3506A|nr:LysE family transporter [Sinobacterium caligoides]